MIQLDPGNNKAYIFEGPGSFFGPIYLVTGFPISGK